MAFTQTPNVITLFFNEKWTPGSKYPKYKNTKAIINGETKNIAVWENMPASGQGSPRLSLKIEDVHQTQPIGESRPVEQCAQATGTAREPSPIPELDNIDELPF